MDNLQEPIQINSGMKQGCILSLSIFVLYFYCSLQSDEESCEKQKERNPVGD
jgi:hypothetical protein